MQNAVFADQDRFFWTLLIPRDAPLAFVLGRPATVAAQIVVEPRCFHWFSSLLSQTYIYSIMEMPMFFQNSNCYFISCEGWELICK